ncbi:AMP-binding protein [Eubacterium xylanophilum]|uniref:AMP-binding protein n=1 Tax=Eubacterium xylanophilum TaxID=39497 RepID=UPI0004B171F4|nr:AMP-binding protein [Eubacterium xylanophilum]
MEDFWNFKRFGNKVALIRDNGNTVSYNELDSMIRWFGEGLQNNSSMIIVCKNNFSTVCAYFACLYKGCVPILVSEELEESSICDLAMRYKVQYIMTSNDGLKNKFRTVYSNLFSERYSLYRLREEEININPKLALLLSTSGSTGSRKFVRISKDNIKANTIDICRSLDIQFRDVAICYLKLDYTYGLSILQTHLYMGCTVVLTEKNIMSGNFWDCVDKYNVTSFSGVPFTYDMLHMLRFDIRKHKSLKMLTQAGGKMQDDELKYWANLSEKNKCSFFVMYGQTEATARMTVLDITKHKDKLRSVGKPIGEGVIKISQDGEVIYSGNNVMMGYAEGWADLCRKEESQLVLYTGDFGYLDEEGYLYIDSRKSIISKICGKRINLEELRDLVYSEIDIRDTFQLFITDDGLVIDIVKALV